MLGWSLEIEKGSEKEFEWGSEMGSPTELGWDLELGCSWEVEKGSAKEFR